LYFYSMKKITFVLIGILISLFASCSSDDVKSSENYINSITFSDISSIEITIRHDLDSIYIYITPEDYDKLLEAEPIIKHSQNAVVSYINSNWVEGFKVTAENGDVRIYNVKIDTTEPKKFSFEVWNDQNGYYIPTGSNSKWASGNAGIKMALQFSSKGVDHSNPKNYPTKDTIGDIGNAVLLETMAGPGDVFGRDVSLLSGNLFYGNFNVTKAMTNELIATELGRNYSAKPKSITGFYKYKEGPGTFMIKGQPAEDKSRKDVCTIKAEFYRSDNNITLNVETIEGSDLVLATASLEPCTETAGDKFHKFEITFGPYKEEPDFQKHNYKLAVTFAASKDGGSYAGKIGTKLIIDEVEFVDY